MKECRMLAVVALVGLAAPLVTGCGRSEGNAESAADTLTQRQRDSIAATLPIPGARAIGKALDASDAAKARAERLDTMLRR